ncbi:MAG: NAD(P)/FAD-dependent oxidoreductase [Planctomycetota bacterium]
MELRVGIVGCGTAGQAAGILLARQGHEVTVLERTPEIRPIGAGLLVQPTGLGVLRRLGVADELLGLGTKVDRLFGTTDRGRVVLDISYTDLRHDLFGLGVQRAALTAVLMRELTAHAIEPILGVQIESADPDVGTLFSADGRSFGPFDLVIAADGARSGLRATVPSLVRRDRPYAWGALWFIGSDSERRYGAELRQIYRGTRRMLGFLPSGKAAPDAPASVSLFWSCRTSEWARAASFDLVGWKNEVRALTDLADPLLDQINDPSQVVFAPYRDAILSRPHHRRLVFLGDAAHAMSPQLGQGVNLALLDAAALVDAIEDAESLEQALRDFRLIRRRNIAFYQSASRWLTPLFQSGISPLAIPRDLLMASLCRFPWTRRQALLSLAGVKTGMLSASPIPVG